MKCASSQETVGYCHQMSCISHNCRTGTAGVSRFFRWKSQLFSVAKYQCNSFPTRPLNKHKIGSLCPQLTTVFHGAALMSSTSTASHFNRLLAAPSANPHKDCVSFSAVCVCVCVSVIEEQSRLPSPHFSRSPSWWN